MKQAVLLPLILLFAGFISNRVKSQTEVAVPQAIIEFDHLTFDYDTVPEGDTVWHSYFFYNKGDAPLEIENAKPSCNCTNADFSPMPIPPGGKGEIKVYGTTQGKSGQSDRSVVVISNAKNRVVTLYLNGFVGPPTGDKKGLNPGGEQIKLGTNPFGWD